MSTTATLQEPVKVQSSGIWRVGAGPRRDSFSGWAQE